LGASAGPLILYERSETDDWHTPPIDLKGTAGRYCLVEPYAVNFRDEVYASGWKAHLKNLTWRCEVRRRHLMRGERRSKGGQGFEDLLRICGFGSHENIDVLCGTRLTVKGYGVPADDNVFGCDQGQLNQ